MSLQRCHIDFLITESATRILKEGTLRIRMKRAGMIQFVVFKVRRIKLGNGDYPELYSDRVIELGELQRVADEIGLPVSAQNGNAFPSGKGAADFIGIG